jgi:DNA polymerase-3 subunit gamma/tau
LLFTAGDSEVTFPVPVSYQVIARKYRPQRFEDVVGQEHVTTTLANAIRAGRIAHGYLFCGPRGTGKTTLARIFAKALNCTGGPKAEFDETDPRVREITEGRSLDVLEIDGASNNGVDQVRELRDTARFAPAAGRFKIYIIDEVHMLSTAAFNALLKTLEEPPAHVKFLFATTDPEKVLPTILSRCQRFDLRRIPSALIVRHLAWIAGEEKVEIDDAALHAIARGADGGMRDAESTLDQLISFCGGRIVESDVLSMFGLAARAQLLDLAGAILVSDSGAVLRQLDALAKSGKDLGRLLSDLLNHFRNLLLYLVGRGDTSLIEASEAEIAALKEQSNRVDAEALTRVMEVLSGAEGRIRDVASKRIFLEVTLLKSAQAREAIPLDGVLKQLRTLRDQAGSASPAPAATPAREVPLAPIPAPARPAPIPTPSPAPEPRIVPAVATPVSVAVPGPSLPVVPVPMVDPTDLDAVWKALLAGIPATEPLLRSSLLQCRPTSLMKGALTLTHPADVYIETPRNVASLKSVLKAATGVALDVRFVQTEAVSDPIVLNPTAPPPREAVRPSPVEPKSPEARPKPVAPVQLNKEDFLNDPLVRQALEVFKGRIIEVRGATEGIAPE